MDFTTNNHLKLAELMHLCRLEFMVNQIQPIEPGEVPPGFEEESFEPNDDPTTIR